MNLYHLPNYAGTGSAAKVHLLWIVIVFPLTRETSSLFVHPQHSCVRTIFYFCVFISSAISVPQMSYPVILQSVAAESSLIK